MEQLGRFITIYLRLFWFCFWTSCVFALVGAILTAFYLMIETRKRHSEWFRVTTLIAAFVSAVVLVVLFNQARIQSK